MNDRREFGHVFTLYVPIACAVFGIVCLLVLFSVLRYRAGRPHEPSSKSQHKLVEPLYALALVGIAAFLAVYAASADATEKTPLPHPRLHVTIAAFRWCWSFHYAGTPVTVTATCNHRVPHLVVPTGEDIQFSLISEDVIHEWWVPGLRWKAEAFPGHYNVFDMNFSQPGFWQGACSEYCGLYHDQMDFTVRAVRPAVFRQFIASATARAGSTPRSGGARA